MSPSDRVTLTIYTGATFPGIVFTCKDGAGDAVDLTGWTPHMHMRKTADGALVYDFTPAVTDAAAGEITVPKIAEGVTTELPVGLHLWDLLLDNPDGDRLGPYAAGDVVVKRKITNPN